MYTYGHPTLGVLIAFCPTHNVLILQVKSHHLPPQFPHCMLWRFSGLCLYLLSWPIVQSTNGKKLEEVNKC